MQQMLERLVDVVGGDESMGVPAGVGDQFRESCFEDGRKDEKEERQIALHPAGRCRRVAYHVIE